MTVRLFPRCLASLLILLAAAGCASGPKKPAEVRLALQASADTNPDASGRPSPVVVRVYQLKNDAAFTAAVKKEPLNTPYLHDRALFYLSVDRKGDACKDVAAIIALEQDPKDLHPRLYEACVAAHK